MSPEQMHDIGNLVLYSTFRPATAFGQRVSGKILVGIHHIGFWVDDVAATRKTMEAAGGSYWMGEPAAGDGFYEVKYRDPNGVVVDITENGWGGAAKEVVAAAAK